MSKGRNLPIIYYGNPLLRKRCEPVEKITDEIRQLVEDMIVTFDLNNGIGISACQVGIPIRLFVLRNYIEQPDGELTVSEPVVYINPKITILTDETSFEQEGCLSLPDLRAQVERPLKIHIEAMNLVGEFFEEEIEGYNARVRMHENDHLNGVLFIDRLDAHTRSRLEPFLKEIKKRFKS